MEALLLKIPEAAAQLGNFPASGRGGTTWL